MKRVLFFVCLFSAVIAYSQENRLALVIGNGDYENAGTLANPENDAKAIAKKLKELDFEVIERLNLDQKSMKKAIDEFGELLKDYDVGLFFYAGHGLQVDGNNYLIPADADLSNANDVEYDCVRADRVLGKMESSNSKTNIVILDACRDNPFERSWNRGVKGKGLAFMNAPSGSLIAYATSPGTTASDGTGKNGAYTEALLKHIGTTNVSIENIFKRVRISVEESTGGQQMPWEYTSLMGSFYFDYDENLPEMTEEEIPSQWVIITTDPEGGDLYINDQHMGQTPFQQEMKEGRYTYSIEKELYHKETGQFSLIADEGRQKVEVVLKPNFGFAKIVSAPEDGATVSIDGTILPGGTPVETGKLKSGEHTLTVSKNMFKSHSQSFTIVDGQTTELNVNMIPTFGKLIINSFPEDSASISLNGQPMGEVTPYTHDRLSSGEYTLTIRKEWYETKNESFRLTDGESKVLNINLKPIFGEVNIISEPGAEIYIDGQLKGSGTYSGRLTAGLHTMEAKKENFQPGKEKMEIVVGEKHEIDLKLKPMEGTLKVVATPLDTRIALNGNAYGTTPQTIKKLAAGTYILELKKPGYETIQKEIEIFDKKVTEINETLIAVAEELAENVEAREAVKTEENPGASTEEKKSDSPRKKASREKTKEASKEAVTEIKTGKTILLSTVIPGYGLTKLSGGKPYWLITVAEAAGIASAVYFNQQAAASYRNYRRPVTVEQARTDYVNAVMQQRISRASAITAAGIWIGQFTITTVKLRKLNTNSSAFEGKSSLHMGYRADPVSGMPMLSLNYSF